MRFRRLNIHRYGHFSEAALEFSGTGLQLIHGQNEAGKSTLLQFVREILFGFAERNRYAFQGEKLEGSALLEFSKQSASAELRRRKGRPDALTLTQGNLSENISESELQRLLGGANDQLFQKVFAFGLSELAEGETSLKIEAVQHALHGSGLSGLTNPQKMLDQLTKDAEAIYKERGSKQEIATLCQEIKNLGGQLKEKITRTETYLQRKREHDTAKAQAEKLAEQLGQLRRDHARAKKLSTAFPLWRELTDLRERRTALGAPSTLTSHSRPQFEKLLEELKRLTREGAKLEREIQTADAELQKNPAQTEWLSLRSQIEQARELIVSVQEARKDLPLLEAELKSDRQAVKSGIEDVIASWSITQLEEFRCDAGQRSRCEQAAELKRELDNERIRLQDRETTLSEEEAANQVDLNSLGQLPDVTALLALLNKHADQIARETELVRLTKDSTKQQRAVTNQRRQLSPPLPAGVSDIGSLPVPPGEQIKQYQLLYKEVRSRLSKADQSLIEARDRQEKLELELAAARGSLTEIPTPERLQSLRAERDQGWELIERRYISGTATPQAEEVWLSPSSESLPGAFRRSMQAADDYSDKMFSNASLVHQQEQVEAAIETVAMKHGDVEAQQQGLATLDAQWRALWQPCGFEPFDPDTMLTWKSYYNALLDMLAKQADVNDDINHLQQEISEFNVRLTTALPQFQGGADERLEAARALVNRHQQATQDLKTYQRQTAKLEKAAEHLRADQQSFETRQQQFAASWKAWLKELQFPADWQPDLALVVISRLQHLRDKLQQIPALESRLSAMRQRLAEFDPLVAQLCDQVAVEWKTQPTEVAARHLADRLQAALATDSRRTALAREMSKHRTRLDEIKDQQTGQQNEFHRLLELAGVGTAENFLVEAQRAETILDLEAELVTKERELARLREFEEEAAFLAELHTIDFGALEASRRTLEQQISLLEDDERKANELKGATGKELEQLDGSAAAADIQTTINQRRAALANAVDRFVPLLFARQLLQQTLQRFEKESQPEMLNDVSRLFAAMTSGRYQRVERPRDASRPLIVYRAGNSDDLEPHQLSTGTREQLYLAIRLAYVLHYCTKAEPLPIVLDDVCANFDPERTRQTLEALGQITDRVQVLLFTCHPHVVSLAQQVFADLKPIAVPAIGA